MSFLWASHSLLKFVNSESNCYPLLFDFFQKLGFLYMGHFTSIKIHSVKKTNKCFYTSTFKSFCTFSFCPYSIISLFFYFILSSPLISDIFITSHLHSKCLLVVSKIFHHFVFHFTCLTVIFPIIVFFSLPNPTCNMRSLSF